jgi:hypothetical protein
MTRGRREKLFSPSESSKKKMSSLFYREKKNLRSEARSNED